MTENRQRFAAAAAVTVLAALVATGCDSPEGRPPLTPSQPPTSTTSPVPTAIAASNIDVRIRPAAEQLSVRQSQVMKVFTDFTNSRNRFYSHPWIIDPVYARGMLANSTYAPLMPTTVGYIGPLIIQVLSVEAMATTAKVTYCVDDRALRYLGRDGAVDIPDHNGDRAEGTVSLEDTQFEFTTAAAADGSTSTSPRWLASKGGLSAGAKECKALAASKPQDPPTGSPGTATP